MFRSTEYLIPNVIKRRQRDQARPYAVVLSSNGARQQVDFEDLENCSNRAAWLLDSLPGCQVLYMGPSDVRYAIWLIAAIKTGRSIVFPSLANNVTANERFFETLGCKTLLHAPEAKSALAPLLEAVNGTIECIATPSYETMMSKDVTPIYPFDKAFEEAQNDVFMCLHTSGTSGHPKPIFWNHLAAWSIVSYLDPNIISADGQPIIDGYKDIVQGRDVLLPMALSHFSGIGNIIAAMYSDTTLFIPAPGTSLTPDNLTFLLQESKCSSAFLAPFMLEAMMNYPPALEALKSLRHIVYSGGPLNPIRGQHLAEQVPHLFNLLASSEGGPCCLYPTTDNSHWNAFKFYNVGQRMDEVAPGIFELVYPRRSELIDRTHAYFHTQPHVGAEYRTSDLFSPLDDDSHQSGWWTYRGRADNWVAMANGLKIDPTDLESAVASLPQVQGALVAGSHRPSLCLLVELVHHEQQQADQHDDDDDDDDDDHLHEEQTLETLWPTIAAANAKVNKFGRVPRELVLFAAPNKPFQRASKGTIQRRLTVQAYELEIDALYDKVEQGLLAGSPSLPSMSTREEVIAFLETLCTETLLDEEPNKNKSGVTGTLVAHDNLLAENLDSRSAFVLLARLRGVLRKSGVKEEIVQKIDSELLFAAATVHQLASSIGQLVSSSPSASL
ncbi:hypothetical protein GGR56DRAFT_378745 [Xylariaceae sp. FL0804]|nr:hypothetical protein GGR56DRAFT_378745 [Xylariaceae sp. FL0804]